MNNHQKRIGCLGWIGRILLVIVGVLVLTGLAGTVVRANLRAQYPPTGQMVDVGGYRLHIDCRGEGSPTVIIEAGQGGMGVMYSNIQAELANNTRVCVYDRAGLGWSDMGGKTRSAETAVDELHTLLHNADIEGPYVLVGHSLGGLISLLFTKTYPDEVAGVVLLDTPHMDRYTRAPEREIKSLHSIAQIMPIYYGAMTAITLAGIPALLPGWQVDTQGLSPEVAEVYTGVLKSSVRIVQGTSAELGALERYYQQVQAAGITSLGDLPLIAVTHTRPQGYMGYTPEEIEASEAAWRQFQDELVSLSTQGKLIAADSGHNIHLEQPDLVIQSVLEVLNGARAQSK